MNRVNKFLLFSLFFLFFISLFYLLKKVPLNPDTYWHLSSGREIIQNRGLPEVDNFSYTGPTRWYSHEWLFDVVVYAVSKITGIDNLFYFNLILWLIIIFELFLIIKIKTNLLNLPVYLPFFLMAVYLLLPFVVLRPHVFTYIFLLYFLYVLENEPIKKNYPLYFSLPFATIIWVNFHAATITGIFVITCYLIH
jgi:hypothetical protein